jgi:pimeloyl-ACP methyl ester carboxylesterase
VAALKNCTKPKLIIYGTDDMFSVPDNIKKLYQEIPEPKMIKEENCVHDYRYCPEVIKDVEVEMGRFLDKYQLV